MERIDAESLDRRLVAGGPLEARAAARLVALLARAVHFAHDHGIVHRDLKPSNVLLAGGSLERPKIADFGLALVQGGERLTQSSAFVGTPCYLAPEVILGETAGPASDVYALGAILYECLLGRPPFMGATIGAILEKALKERPAAPRRIRASVPAALERVALLCLEKVPQHRPPSAAAVASALERFLGERRKAGAVEAARESVGNARAALFRASQLLLGLALGLVAGFLVGLALVGAW
jgi:serine/threonine-protein kinase